MLDFSCLAWICDDSVPVTCPPTKYWNIQSKSPLIMWYVNGREVDEGEDEDKDEDEDEDEEEKEYRMVKVKMKKTKTKKKKKAIDI